MNIQLDEAEEFIFSEMGMKGELKVDYKRNKGYANKKKQWSTKGKCVGK